MTQLPDDARRDGAAPFDTAVLDIDGTLVDSVYAHVWAWHEALRSVGVEVPAWRVHRAIGMGGDRIVTALTNPAVEASVGDAVREHHRQHFSELWRRVAPTPGATDLLAELKRRDLKVVVASSASRDETADALALLEAERWLDGSICGQDVEESKPSPEPIQRAVAAVGGHRAVTIGDAVWDVFSAREAGHVAVGVLTGGIGEAELLEAGAASVHRDPEALVDVLDEVLAGS